jgi:quercetin dioxygenase-like cupin family protein
MIMRMYINRVCACLWALAAILVVSAPVAAQAEVQALFRSALDGLGQALSYPGGAPAELSGSVVTLEPGASTGWHRHAVPVAGYLLSGELTVEYAGGEQRVFRAGDGIVEAMQVPHNGYNAGTVMVRIVAFFAGAPGIAVTEAVEPPR